ncbi:MAG: hydrogenase 3 large subunit [Zestosphaera tikiterensis]|uniref:Hydrogenase 3 large subunit n=1 Tax=Zestosphaera tikiterensis TaxID=1973259 RepID=A0A2R7Y339_9CREN|nr:MAG: hydrogenase 3 large subunit [Zestosphaera tikiterensis]
MVKQLLIKEGGETQTVKVLNRIKDLCGPHTSIEFIHDKTVKVSVKSECLRKVAEALQSEEDVYLRTMVASDEKLINDSIKLYYVFGLDREGVNVILEVKIPAALSKHYEIPSISDVVKACDWYELEAHDLMGVKFSGRFLKRLVLPDDWPEEIHPLKKDITTEEIKKLYQPQVREKALEVGAEEVALIPVGPYHPALHEPEYFELYIKEEKVVDARYVGFMVHRGIEKLGESMGYDQIPFLAERICGICGFVHSVSYTQAVEEALNIEVPEKTQYIRTIILELERIHSHLLWLGIAAHLLGYDTGFMYAWRIREKVMVLSELLTGSRKTYGINLVGGVRKDINKEKIEKTKQTLKEVWKDYKGFAEVLLNVPQVRRRLSGTGVLPGGEARAYSLVGPTARGSGLSRDVRKDYTYGAYHFVSFSIPTYSEGDNLARTLVRIDEVYESINIIEQLLDTIPSGSEIKVNSWEPQPMKLGLGNVEAPRGEVIHLVITGMYGPYRWRVRSPTYQNLQAVPTMLRGVDLADAPITIASIDPCFSCTDRAIKINIKTGKIERVPLIKLSVKGGS